jgi:hypothetical protein
MTALPSTLSSNFSCNLLSVLLLSAEIPVARIRDGGAGRGIVQHGAQFFQTEGG